jgi:hypothetical protein
MVCKLKCLFSISIPLIFFLFLWQSLLAAAEIPILTCNVPQDFSTIQAAVDDVTCDTIILDSGTFIENVVISRMVTIAGQSALSTIVDGNAAGSVFTVLADGVVLSDMMLTNGSAASGGGVFSEGILAIHDTIVSNNYGNEGGGIFNKSQLNIHHSAIVSNTGGLSGGGLFNENSATVVINFSLFSGNMATSGGAIVNASFETAMVIDNSTIHNNEASYGGGIMNGETLMLNHTNTIGNSSSEIAVNNGSDNLFVSNSTISSNSAVVRGGGILSPINSVVIIHSTIVSNSAYEIGNEGGGNFYGGPLTIGDSIIANSLAGSDCNPTSAPISEGYNLDSDGTCNLTNPTDLPNTNPMLGVLQDNGGPTTPLGPAPTHALLLGSPAIDHIPTDACKYSYDQRDIIRPQGSACDIGAFELQQNFLLTVTKSGTGSGQVNSIPAGIDCGDVCSAEFTPGTSVTLTAVADTGVTFSGWSGDCVGIDICILTMDMTQNVTATFTLDEKDDYLIYLPAILKP